MTIRTSSLLDAKPSQNQLIAATIARENFFGKLGWKIQPLIKKVCPFGL